MTWLYFPYMGGVQTHVYEVATRLASAQHNVTVLSTDPKGALPREELSAGLTLIRVPSYPANRDYYFAPALYRTIRQGSWDIIHVQGINTFVAPLAMLGAIHAALPFVITPHTGHHASRLRTMIRPAQYGMLRPLLRRTKKLIGLSSAEVDMYRKILHLPETRFTIIPNGSDLPPVETPLAADRERPLILSVGRLDRLKGHQHVIAALPLVAQHYPEVRLRIVGEGDYEAELRRLATSLGVAERVQIKGVPPWQRHQLAELFAQSALVTCFSSGENNPIAALEAISTGCSVLVTYTSGLAALADRDLVRSIPLGSTPTQTAEAMMQQIRQPFTPKNVDLLRWKDCVNAIFSVYQEGLRN